MEVDDEALEVFAKEKQEADGKKMEEAAKNNDLSKADFTEKGCGPITLGKKVKSLPDNYENLYTSYKWKVDQGVNAKVYTFYNGSEEVATLYANIKNGEIFLIFVKSDKITIKFDGGKTLKPGMLHEAETTNVVAFLSARFKSDPFVTLPLDPEVKGCEYIYPVETL